jgi:hypothetical protein
MTRTCKRCGKKEQTIGHTWGELVYERQGEWTISQKCQRCGRVKDQDIRHNWGKLAYERDGNCYVSQECQRCGQRKDRTIAHNWTAWGWTSGEYAERVCKRCGGKERAEAQPCTSCEQGTTTCMGCNGRGYNRQQQVAPGVGGSIGSVMVQLSCRVCQGSGVISCRQCDGSGVTWSVRGESRLD